MADQDTVASADPLDAGFEFGTVSTPLRRAAARLSSALPDGWHVEVVDAPNRPDTGVAPVLRLVSQAE